MGMKQETAQALRDARDAYVLSLSRNGGQQVARTRYINLLFAYEGDIMAALKDAEEAEKKIKDLTEENEMLNEAIEKQDKELDELKAAAAPKTTARKK